MADVLLVYFLFWLKLQHFYFSHLSHIAARWLCTWISNNTIFISKSLIDGATCSGCKPGKMASCFIIASCCRDSRDSYAAGCLSKAFMYLIQWTPLTDRRHSCSKTVRWTVLQKWNWTRRPTHQSQLCFISAKSIVLAFLYVALNVIRETKLKLLKMAKFHIVELHVMLSIPLHITYSVSVLHVPAVLISVVLKTFADGYNRNCWICSLLHCLM